MQSVSIMAPGKFPLLVPVARFEEGLGNVCGVNEAMSSSSTLGSCTVFVSGQIAQPDKEAAKKDCTVVIKGYSEKAFSVATLAQNTDLIALKGGVSTRDPALRQLVQSRVFNTESSVTKYGLGSAGARVSPTDFRPRSQLWDDLRQGRLTLAQATKLGGPVEVAQAQNNLQDIKAAFEAYAGVMMRRSEWLARNPSEIEFFASLDRLNVDETVLLYSLIDWARMRCLAPLDSLPQENDVPLVLPSGYTFPNFDSKALWAPELLGPVEKYVRWTEITDPEVLEKVLSALPNIGGKGAVLEALRKVLVSIARLRKLLGNLTSATGLLPRGTKTKEPSTGLGCMAELEESLTKLGSSTLGLDGSAEGIKRAASYLELKGRNKHKRPTARQRRQLRANFLAHRQAVQRKLLARIHEQESKSDADSTAVKSTEEKSVAHPPSPTNYRELRDHRIAEQVATSAVSEKLSEYAKSRSVPFLVECKSNFEGDAVPISPITVLDELLKLAYSEFGKSHLLKVVNSGAEAIVEAEKAVEQLKSALTANEDDIYLSKSLPFPLLSPRRARYLSDIFDDTCYISFYESFAYSDLETKAPPFYLHDAKGQLTLDVPIGPCATTWGFEILAADEGKSEISVGITWVRKFKRENDTMVPVRQVDAKASTDGARFEARLHNGAKLPIRSTIWCRAEPIENTYQIATDMFPYWVDVFDDLKRFSGPEAAVSKRYIASGYGILVRDIPDWASNSTVARGQSIASRLEAENEHLAASLVAHPHLVGAPNFPRDAMPTVLVDGAFVRGVRPMNYE